MNIQTKDREKIVEQIQKCFAHVGNNPNENEVANAVRVAKCLMAKYNLTMSDVEQHEAAAGKPVEFEINEHQADTARNYAKYEYLLSQVCDQLFETKHFFYCRKDWKNNAGGFGGQYVSIKTLTFVGVPAEAALASQVYHLLRKMVMRMARAQFGQQKWTVEHNSYALGFSAELCRRSEKPAPEYTGNRSLALVVVSKEQALTKYWDAKEISESKSRGKSNIDPLAYGQGREDGTKINLDFRNAINA